MTARDAPISTLDPQKVGALSEESVRTAAVDDRVPPRPEPAAEEETQAPQVLEDPAPQVTMVAVRPAWVRVRGADGSVIFEGILNAGDTYKVPSSEEPAKLRAGESGAIYFAVDGKHYGPAGPDGAVTSDLALTADALTDTYDVADLDQDEDLSRYVAEAVAQSVGQRQGN